MDATKIDLGDDTEGYVVICFGGVEKKLDLYDVVNHIWDLYDRVEMDEQGNRPRGVWDDMVVNWLVDLGFPQPSKHMAAKVVASVMKRYNELKNAVGGSEKPDSSASTTDAETSSS